MSATTTWYEENGSATGSPAHGTASVVTTCDWKSTDSATDTRANAPVSAGSNSYQKYNYVKFSGTFNEISDVKFAHTSGTLGSGLTLVGKITSTYTTPSTSSMAGSSNITNPISIDSGSTVLLSSVGAYGANPSATLSTEGYTQYICTQVQSTNSASSGDSGTVTLSIQYNEN